ncbi:ferric reduction oxidase 7, chloroplastic-like [Phragmites australis]|uniref:ferric reduction oxidase 7, chloroplastic-like n=1 Tax=Phragmites australis TaxID=29695 RepID=UPI002D7651D1|nr:ferric reduction oxidase 7, chloroplastic-like [Phragmites australis]
MAQERDPLLQQNGGGSAAGAGAVKCSSSRAAILPSLARSVLKFLMWAVFLTWAAGIFLYPTKPAQAVFRKCIGLTRESLFGITGSIFLTFSAPILIIALLAYVYISAFPSDHVEKKKLRSLSFRLWTFPVLVDGPFGVVSAVEFIGIVLFVVYVVYSMTYYTVESVSLVSKFHLPSSYESELILDVIGLRLGSVGLFCMLFLFLPVSRGSVLLRLIDIPFEHATRYHVWLGHLTMALFTLHGLFYVISWSMQGRLLEEMLEWKEIGVANLPGVISLAAGLLMWATSLHPVRKRFFELFFYTHQLYVVFILFLAFHVGDFIFSISAGAVFLFMLDRFLRFWQSRAKVDIISAASRPCGTVELVFSKPASLRYNALSFVFIQVRELSFLQWHPFSVSSSPMDGRYHMSVLIKVLGSWTEKLRSIITDVQEQNRSDSESQSGRITACVEGPYGHESPYHLMYENLILVAGGIGISPFLAILSDIIHRIEEGKPCMPKNVLVLWSVKKSKELSLLSAVDTQTISSSVSDKLRLDIQAFVTQESQPPLEDGIVGDEQKVPGMFVKNGTTMSGLVGTGDNFWAAMYFSASTLGFVLAYALVQVYYVKPNNVVAWWYLGLLFMLCMAAGVALPGGLVVLLWHLSEKRRLEDYKWDAAAASQSPRSYQTAAGGGDDNAPSTSLAALRTTRYGCRPNFGAEFAAFAERAGDAADVGVLVCGPQGLQTSVARECRARNLGCGGGPERKGRSRAVFHFNSHSFDL